MGCDLATHDQARGGRGNMAAQRNGCEVGSNKAVDKRAGVGARRRRCANNKSRNGRQRDLAGVMGQIIKRVLGLRDKFDTGRRILIQKLDVKSDFRRPVKAAKFRYVWRGYCFINLRLQFGWRESSGR